MNKFIKLTKYVSGRCVFINTANITYISVNQYDEVSIHMTDKDYHIVREDINIVMNLING